MFANSAPALRFISRLRYRRTLSTGDAHAPKAREVCINGIECPVDATLRFHLHKESITLRRANRICPPLPQHALDEAWIVIESDADAVTAARAATSRMIDLLISRWSLSRCLRLSSLQRRPARPSELGRERTHVHSERVDRKAHPSTRKLF